jgi:proteasome accessory factor B
MPARRSAPQSQPEERLLRIIAFLFAHPGASREAIWEEFHSEYTGSLDAKEKKWGRDKQTLEEAGVPIVYVDGDPDLPAGYRIDPREFFLPSIDFTGEEMAVLWAAGRAAVQIAGHPWHADLESALRKLRWFRSEGPVPALRPMITFAARPVGEHDARFVEVLGEAIRRRKRVTLKYFTAKRQDEAVREVDVYGFAWRRGVWLFAGWCHLRKALRVFYLSRVREIAINKKKPTEPDYAIPRDFDMHTFSDQQPWDYWVHERKEVEVLFRAKAGGDVNPALVSQQVPGARTEERPEGVLARVIARNADALVRHVLSLGLDAEILAPPELRAVARQQLATIAAGGEP